MLGFSLLGRVGYGPAKATGGGTSPALAIAGTPVTTAAEGVAYVGFTVSASGGSAPYAYSLVGTWPAGITVDSSTGDVSGTPTESGSFTGLSVRVTDAASNTADLDSFTLTIAAAAAGPTPTYRAHSFNAVSGTTSNSVAYPAGLAEDDIMLLCVVYDPNSGTGVSPNAPSGFTQVGTSEATDNAVTALFWARATGAESGSLSVTLNGTMAASRIFYVSLAAYSGCLDVGSPIDALSQTHLSTNPGPVEMATLTTTGANRRCVCFMGGTTGGTGAPGRIVGPASGWTAIGTNTSSTGYDGMIRFDEAEQVSAGSPTNDNFGSSTKFNVAVIAVALKPNPAA